MTGRKQVRSIELAAQASKAVVYTARLVGHPDFSLEASTIRVEPGTTASFAVQCKASTTNPQVCSCPLSPCTAFAPAVAHIGTLDAVSNADAVEALRAADSALYTIVVKLNHDQSYPRIHGQAVQYRLAFKQYAAVPMLGVFVA